MNKSEQIGELAAALAKTQAVLNRAKESATNPFLKNSYADLGDCWDAAREPMTANGLSVAQFPTGQGDSIGLVTVLMHSSGQYIEDVAYLPLGDERGKSQAQVAGSIISYLRRYGLSAVLGIVTGDDDDGNAGSDPRKPAKRDTRAETSPQAQAERKRPEPEPAKASSNGNGIDWKAKAMGQKFPTFASCLVNAGAGYASDQHVENALEKLGENFSEDDTERLWDVLVSRKEQDAA